jgi:hypothetical protein
VQQHKHPDTHRAGAAVDPAMAGAEEHTLNHTPSKTENSLMKVGPGATLTPSLRPSRAMFKLAVEAVTTGRIPPVLRDVEPMKVLLAIAYVFFLEQCMKGRIDINEADAATVTKYFNRARQKAEAMLAEQNFPVPECFYVPTEH